MSSLTCAGCSYCEELRQGPGESIARHLKSRLLVDDGEFVVFPTLGHMVPGYLLVATKDHVVSMAGLRDDQRPRLYSLLKQLCEMLEKEYGAPVLVYEHGDTVDGAKGGSCIAHAHIHLVPTQTIPETPDLQLGEACTEDYLAVAHPTWASNVPYLYIAWPYAEGRGRIVPATGLPAQYMRRRLATGIGKPDEWDWGVFKEIPALVATYARLRPICERIDEGSRRTERTS